MQFNEQCTGHAGYCMGIHKDTACVHTKSWMRSNTARPSDWRDLENRNSLRSGADIVLQKWGTEFDLIMVMLAKANYNVSPYTIVYRINYEASLDQSKIFSVLFGRRNCLRKIKSSVLVSTRKYTVMLGTPGLSFFTLSNHRNIHIFHHHHHVSVVY
jgi:hypothetical protein